jgi:hypothetical protein
MKIMFTSCRVSMPRNLCSVKTLFGVCILLFMLVPMLLLPIFNNCVSGHPSLVCNPAKGRAAGGEVCTNQIKATGVHMLLGMQVSEDCWPVGSRDQAVFPVAEPGTQVR